MFRSGKGNGKDREKGRLLKEINEKYDDGKPGALFHLERPVFGERRDGAGEPW
jgi:hypothetical protein